jgi:polysaccharide deacetylase family protein (PEP-CTERM system associated)
MNQKEDRLNALTIDVEDYYQVSAFESVVRFEDWSRYESRVERNTHRLLELLDEHRTKATFFVLGWVAERCPKLIRGIAERGHEVASHGYSHRLVYLQTPEAFRDETRRSKKLIEDAAGCPIEGYRAASYSITRKSLWALRILEEEGFLYDSSIYPIHHDRYGLPDFPRFCHRPLDDGRLVEIPLSTVRLAGWNVPVAGGGYFRLFPYAVTRWAVRHLNEKEGQPAIVYLHPWEVDHDQPRMNGSWLSRFRHYNNLEKTEPRLRLLLKEFRFDTLRNFAGRLIQDAPSI